MPRHNSSFNSILVRLKVCMTTGHVVLRSFQFHTGSIKRIWFPNGTVVNYIEFQFHTGSIKSEIRPRSLSVLAKFQFHTGSIKSNPVPRILLHDFVSIPYWFD